MKRKKIALTTSKLVCIIVSVVMLLLSLKNLLGFGASKIYADDFSYWITSLIPLCISALFIELSTYLYKRIPPASL